MPGTSAGMRKAWATRREKYGPSGRSDAQTLAKSSSKPKSSSPRSSKNTNRAKRNPSTVNGYKLPYDRQLTLYDEEREDVLKSIRAIDRTLSSGKEHRGASYINEIYRDSRNKLTVRLRRLDDLIALRQREVIDRENKKHGRRYT